MTLTKIVFRVAFLAVLCSAGNLEPYPLRHVPSPQFQNSRNANVELLSPVYLPAKTNAYTSNLGANFAVGLPAGRLINYATPSSRHTTGTFTSSKIIEQPIQVQPAVNGFTTSNLVTNYLPPNVQLTNVGLAPSSKLINYSPSFGNNAEVLKNNNGYNYRQPEINF